MTTPLESLSDSALSEAVALEVAGWVHDPARLIMYGDWYRPGSDRAEGPPVFATSAEAVLPLLEKTTEMSVYWHHSFGDFQWNICVNRILPHGNGWEGQAVDKTFARAACIALLKAERAKKG